MNEIKRILKNLGMEMIAKAENKDIIFEIYQLSNCNTIITIRQARAKPGSIYPTSIYQNPSPQGEGEKEKGHESRAEQELGNSS